MYRLKPLSASNVHADLNSCAFNHLTKFTLYHFFHRRNLPQIFPFPMLFLKTESDNPIPQEDARPGVLTNGK